MPQLRHRVTARNALAVSVGALAVLLLMLHPPSLASDQSPSEQASGRHGEFPRICERPAGADPEQLAQRGSGDRLDFPPFAAWIGEDEVQAALSRVRSVVNEHDSVVVGSFVDHDLPGIVVVADRSAPLAVVREIDDELAEASGSDLQHSLRTSCRPKAQIDAQHKRASAALNRFRSERWEFRPFEMVGTTVDPATSRIEILVREDLHDAIRAEHPEMRDPWIDLAPGFSPHAGQRSQDLTGSSR